MTRIELSEVGLTQVRLSAEQGRRLADSDVVDARP